MTNFIRSSWLIWYMLVLLGNPINAQKTIYVSPQGNDQNNGSEKEAPILSIQKAIDLCRDHNYSQVVLLPGTYRITEPLRLGTNHSGSATTPLTITGENPGSVIISGGRSISGWQKFRKNIWYADIPEVKTGDWWFNQLFVDGAQQIRARIPNQGFNIVQGFPEGTSKTVHYHTDCQRFEFADGDIDPSWRNLDDAEVIVYHFWTDSHLPIQSVDTENNIVTFKHKAGKVFTDDFTENGARFIVEHVFEGLDMPGEWYLDRKKGRLYLIPPTGTDLSSAEIIAPVIPKLIHIEGNAGYGNWAENIHFTNITFTHTNWQLPAGNSNDRQGSSSVPAAVNLVSAKGIQFSNCRFNNLGTFGIEIGEGCQNNHFQYNRIENIAAGAFRINGADESGHPLLRTHSNIISDNMIKNYGTLYPSAVGILLMHTYNNQVIHNEIAYGYYTGISIGWEWGYQQSISRDNIIAYNHIHHIGQGLLSDMGGIYTLGVSPGTVIRNNMIHDIDANHYGGWGIYHDEGSSHLLVENNVVYNTKFAPFNIHYAKEIMVRNNIFALGRLQQLSRGRMEQHKSVYFENNIVYWKEGVLLDKNWKDHNYTFYFHPKNKKGNREVNSTFEMDYNLYYNPKLPVDSIDFNGNNFKDWQKRGKDHHSIYADPLFVDPENYDFKLKLGSPAFDLGFENIATDLIGPRKQK